jgi:hypothetical protein
MRIFAFGLLVVLVSATAVVFVASNVLPQPWATSVCGLIGDPCDYVDWFAATTAADALLCLLIVMGRDRKSRRP